MTRLRGASASLGGDARCSALAQILFACAKMSARGGYNIFFDHDASHIVGSKTQSHLSEFQALCEPRTLNIFNIVQKDARDCEGLQEVCSSRRRALKQSIFGLKSPADEGHKTVSFILQIANSLQVLYAFLKSLYMSEHHSCAGS